MSMDLSGIPQFSGARIRRREDPALITGQGKYTADFHEEGTLYLAFVRSPYAHATILSVDSDEAQAMAGVVAVLTGADINPKLAGGVPSGMSVSKAPYSEGKRPARQVLTEDKVRFMGEAVAVVVATSPAAAADAVEAVFVDYEPLDVVVDPDAALAEGAPIIHEAWDSNVAFRWGQLGGKWARFLPTLPTR